MTAETEIKELVKSLDNPTSYQRIIAIGEPAVASLAELLQDEDPIVRAWSVTALGEIGGPSAEAALSKALNDEEYRVSWKAAEALENIGSIAPLILAFSSEAPFARDVAIKIFQRTDPKWVVLAAYSMFESNETVVQRTTGEALRFVAQLHRISFPEGILSQDKSLRYEAFRQVYTSIDRQYIEPKPESKGRGESIAFSNFYPETFKSSGEIPLYVYIHLSTAIEQVIADFKKIEPTIKSVAMGTDMSTLLFTRGTVFSLIPYIEDEKGRVVPQYAEVRFEDKFERVRFEIKTREAVKGLLKGGVRIFVGPLVVGQLSLSIKLHDDDTSEDKEEFERETKNIFKKLFISYSRDDSAVVQAVEQLYKSHSEIKTYIDYKFLKIGVNWWEAIESFIEKADAMQLFWSPSSSKSENVEKEWRHALHKLKPILPVIFGRPRPDIPPELGHIHFEDFERFVRTL